jgi:transcriptional regulator with PAS, ATPase and Fis domain
VLIQGESGTGKELIAYEIHRQSDRADRPYIKINCAAIPSTLIESELFGYEKGAFTGAMTSKPGKFELADRGTLFLDEIGEMELKLQPKILRALEDKKIKRVGAPTDTTVDVRIIAATNRDLKKEVTLGKFRQDLLFRLDVMRIEIPPLRNRPEDIEALVDFFVKTGSRSETLKENGISHFFGTLFI